MRYKVKNVAALDIVLGGFSKQRRVEVDPGLGVSATTVGELRKVTPWPGNLSIITPHEGDPKSAVRVSKANVATRLSPKP
jgi:hypothetical protein